jgi:ribosomal protein L29
VLNKDELRGMTVEQLNVYIGRLRRELGWRVGPALKSVTKELAVAEKVRDLGRGQEAAGEV